MDISTLFEQELSGLGVRFEKTDQLEYDVDTPNGNMSISLHNVARAYESEGDPRLVSNFVANMLRTVPELPSWEIAKHQIFPSLQPIDVALSENQYVVETKQESTAIVLAHYRSSLNQLRWIRTFDLEGWGVSGDVAWNNAYNNLDQIMEQTNVSFMDIDGKDLGTIEAQEPYKASLILSKKLKEKVQSKIDWPIYAVAPSRDFVYLFSKTGGLIDRVGNVVVREFKEGAYPISTDVWELSDGKPEPMGAFPTE